MCALFEGRMDEVSISNYSNMILQLLIVKLGNSQFYLYIHLYVTLYQTKLVYS